MRNWLSLGVVALVVGAGVARAQAPAAAAGEMDPKVARAMADGKEALRHRDYAFALDDYKKASKLANGQCVKCLEEVYTLQMGMQQYKDAAATAGQLLAVSKSPAEKSVSEADQAQAMLKQAGDKPKPAQLEAVHATFQASLTEYPKNISARYTDGCVLARMGKNEEASAEFTACADAASPKDPTRIRARHFAENPALSLNKMAPAFEVKALNGDRFNLDDMGGKVVLIDFWATWCGPCNAELPHMKKIAKEFAGQPLVILSISWDSDAEKWKAFVDKNEMTWMQYRDADHELSKRFGVEAIPHYFTIDSDGVLTAEMLGEGSDVEGKLKKLVKRANDAKAAQGAVLSTR